MKQFYKFKAHFPKLIAIFFLLLIGLPAVTAEEKGSPVRSPKPLWSKNGLKICNSIGNSPQQSPLIIQTEDNSIIMVWEDGRFGFTTIYAQKMDNNGNYLWGSNGLPLSTMNTNQTQATIVSDGSGGAIIAWQDYRHDNADIFAQHISSQGELLWGRDGLFVCRAPAGQFAPQMIIDGSGGVIIAWHDYRSGGGEDIYAQRIDRYGSPLWGENGLPVCAASGTQWYPKIVSDNAGGAVIAWTDGRNGSSDNNIYAQRINSAGKGLWEKDGIIVCNANLNQERVEITATKGGAILAWEDSRNSQMDIFAQKVDFNGNLLWDKNAIPVINISYSQERPKLCDDGDGGAVIVWVDNREEESAVYIQRLLSSGKTGWAENGRLLAKSGGSQSNPVVQFNNRQEWLVAWEDARKGYSLIYLQKVNTAGTPVWGTNGILAGFARRDQEKPSLVAGKNGEVFLTWQDRRFGNYDIYAQKLSSDGNILWGAGGMAICHAIGSVVHQNPAIVNAGQGEIIIAFEDARSGYLNVYLQKVNRTGTLLWGKDGLPVARVKAQQTNIRTISDNNGGIILIWEDARDPNAPKIFGQRVNSAGKKLWEKGGLLLGKAPSRQANPAIVGDGAGGALVVWEDDRSTLNLKDIYAQHISGNGDLLLGKGGQAICAENSDQTEPSITADGSGGAIIAWSDFRQGDRNPDIYAQRINGKGKLLWKQEGMSICSAPDVQRSPQAVADKQGGALIAWTDKGGGSYDIYAQRVNSDGKAQWQTDGIPVSQAARTQQNPIIISPTFVLWEDYRAGNWDLFANYLSVDGKLTWGEEGISLANLPMTQYAPQAVGWGDGSYIVAWEDYRNGKQYEIFLQRINQKGKVEWADNGFMVRTADGARAPKITAQPEDNTFSVIWEDYTGGGKEIFGQRFAID